MLKKDLGTLVLTGKSGQSYTFKIYEYDTMASIDDAVKDFTQAGLYVFANKHMKPNDNRNWFSVIYIGETEDYSKRDYSNHHKKDCIKSKDSNTWGYCVLTVSDQKRKDIEADLIANYNPPCNDKL